MIYLNHGATFILDDLVFPLVLRSFDFHDEVDDDGDDDDDDNDDPVL